MILIKKKVILWLTLTVFALAGICAKLYYDKEVGLLEKPADVIYNTIVADESANCDPEVREMADDINFCYETDKFFDDQPVEYYFETKQCSYSRDGGRAFGLAVIKLTSKDGSYEESNDAFDDWLFDWTTEKIRIMHSAYQNQGEDAVELLEPYEKNSAIVRNENTIVILYNNQGIDLLKKYFNDVKPLLMS